VRSLALVLGNGLVDPGCAQARIRVRILERMGQEFGCRSRLPPADFDYLPTGGCFGLGGGGLAAGGFAAGSFGLRSDAAGIM
jgi:hypothetical protein